MWMEVWPEEKSLLQEWDIRNGERAGRNEEM